MPPFYKALIRTSVAVSLVTAAVLPLIVSARPVNIPSVPTNIVGSVDRMISYRIQEHMWQTADGATPLMVNRGPISTRGALGLYTSLDNGANWVAKGAIPNTDLTSTADGLLTGNDLRLVYSDNTGAILSALLQYDPSAGTWTQQRIKSPVVFSRPGVLALSRGMANDSWTASTLFVSEPPYDADPFGGHFSLIDDMQNNLHLVTPEKGRPICFRFDFASQTWEAPRSPTGAVDTGYVQATRVGESVLLVANSLLERAVYRSDDQGLSLALAHRLAHPKALGNTSCSLPRLETPGVSLAPVPLVQQYLVVTTQRQLWFEIPVE